MNKLVEPVIVERVLEEIEDEVTQMGTLLTAPSPRVRSRAAIPIALIVPAIFFGGLVIVLLLRDNPVAAIRGSNFVVDKAASIPASPAGSTTMAAPDPTSPTGPAAQVTDVAGAASKGSTVTDDMTAEESQSALLRFMARGTVKDLPAPRRAAPPVIADALPAPAPLTTDGRAAVPGAAPAAASNAANAVTIANGGAGNANSNAGAPLVASKSVTTTDPRAAGGVDGASTVQAAAPGSQQQTTQGVTQGVAQGVAQGASPSAATSAAPIAAAVIPTPPPGLLRPIEKPTPTFPVDALRDGIRSGRVLAALTVAPDGTVSNVRVLEFAPNVSFSRAAQRALRNWRFAATGTGGQATIELLFKSEE